MFDFTNRSDPLDRSEAEPLPQSIPPARTQEIGNDGTTEPIPRRDTFREMITKGYLPG